MPASRVGILPFVILFEAKTKDLRLQVLVRDNNVDQALKALKKKMQREGIFREMKLRNYYEKPSVRKAREKAEAVRRARKLARKKLQREGLLPSKPIVAKTGGPGGGRGGFGGGGGSSGGGFGGGGSSGGLVGSSAALAAVVVVLVAAAHRADRHGLFHTRELTRCDDCRALPGGVFGGVRAVWGGTAPHSNALPATGRSSR